ncbi:response regulator [Larkinella terrae]|uniref:Response regulator n=1 Tax=Larkinella terrae TaxID=2025311 RepID=A0A7K0EV70_9BACT|nr:response regulator [Larkinella terrae]MRS65715.1 response regulator [Larkinella terrae]
MSISRLKSNPNQNRNPRILVIEDNLDHQLIIENAIQQSFVGVEAVLVATEPEAIDYLDNTALTGNRLPQLILLDLYLPDREDGWNCLNGIKSRSPEIGQIPVIVFSNSAYSEDITESYNLGVASYVVKPADFTEWVEYFQTLKEYWWETVSLPSHKSMY